MPGFVGVLVVAAAVIGCCIGRLIIPSSATEDSAKPAATETVIIVTPSPVEKMPDVCASVLNDMAKIIAEADAVSSHDGEQLDIMSLAYQAIYEKDWKTLNDLAERQRKLWFSLTEETRPVLPEIADIQRDVEQCRRQVGS